MSTMSDFVNSGTVKSVDALSGRNVIRNGHMAIAQRGVSFPAAANNIYNLDGWLSVHTMSGVVTISQDADSPSPYKFNSLKVAVTTASTPIPASNFISINQYVEGHNIKNFFAKTFTLSFWVKSSKIGKYSVCFRNSDYSQAYTTEYEIFTANTWEKKVITVVGGLPNVGTWGTTTGVGIRLSFFLAGASDLTTSTLNSWVTGGKPVTSSQVNFLDTVGATWFLTGVQLELGDRETEFEIKPIPTEIAIAQRFYCLSVQGQKQRLYKKLSWNSDYVRFPVQMRGTPAVQPLNVSTLGDVAGATISASAVGFFYSFTNGNEGCIELNWAASAEL